METEKHGQIFSPKPKPVRRFLHFALVERYRIFDRAVNYRLKYVGNCNIVAVEPRLEVEEMSLPPEHSRTM